jgi:hypothetical protein
LLIIPILKQLKKSKIKLMGNLGLRLTELKKFTNVNKLSYFGEYTTKKIPENF